MERKDKSKLTTQLYAYLEPDNADFARSHGAKLLGSQSAYINALISSDRKKPIIFGKWRPANEIQEENEKCQIKNR